MANTKQKNIPVYTPSQFMINEAKTSPTGYLYFNYKGFWFKVFATGKSELVKNQPALQAA